MSIPVAFIFKRRGKTVVSGQGRVWGTIEKNQTVRRWEVKATGVFMEDGTMEPLRRLTEMRFTKLEDAKRNVRRVMTDYFKRMGVVE